MTHYEIFGDFADFRARFRGFHENISLFCSNTLISVWQLTQYCQLVAILRLSNALPPAHFSSQELSDMAPPDALPTHGAQIRSASPHTRSGSTDGTCPRSLVRVKKRIAVHHMRHNVMRESPAMATVSSDDRDSTMRAI